MTPYSFLAVERKYEREVPKDICFLECNVKMHKDVVIRRPTCKGKRRGGERIVLSGR
jgi:hypothetical protein